ncbi:redox-active disulfide protein 2 [Mesotoga sp. Brook.08.YT.4.2.5.1]|uniref:thioredoxin family protein n=1 Tax=unclassified Mesotoga TaxID=1184398 RepID=UPI000B272852|nr:MULTISPECIES: thioredoxin family protein [unclassified Mesotoga]RAM58399.1 redox-active disulfide protein 2 [Mesotoga sp. SC_4PWL113PWK15]HAY99041.1 thioredoxin family protein [Mesotoga sp.]PNE23459.1 redox-active disulfide protein 2 [Mesotoga sp. Brook.08.YT.4.2.5.1]PNS38760.1 redox-active disulfide protein 2 [Mesotoga sp. B105.6.4]PVD16737.1 redox-active disulfide protein 2 [Mesotoga sp. Brook.08.105.5.1]
MKIEIFGSGCPRCKQTEKIMKKAVEELGSDAEVDKVTDMMAIMEKGIVSTPAVAIDGKIVLSGKIPSIDEAKRLIKG